MRSIIVSTVIGAAAIAMPARAQSIAAIQDKINPPAEISQTKLSEIERGRLALVRYAECLVGRRRAGVVRALSMRHGAESFAEFGKISVSECLSGGNLRFSPIAMRGPLFMALYRADYGRLSMRPAIRSERTDFAGAARLTPADAVYGEFVAARQFADCVVRRAPVLAHAALIARAGSEAEAAAFRALAPDLSQCLPAGQNFRLNKLVLGGLLAEAFYSDAVPAGRAKDG